MDTGTQEIAEKLADLLGQKIGSRPHLVIMEVHRSQIDANREIREACMHCQACEKVYRDYHSKIEESLASIKQGILFDMHGQAHGQNSTEFGYTLPIEVLEAASHNGAEINSSSSIDFLVERSGLSLKSLVMGEQSLGTFLDYEGFDGLPSIHRPLPNENTTYKYYRVRILFESHSKSLILQHCERSELLFIFKIKIFEFSRQKSSEKNKFNFYIDHYFSYILFKSFFLGWIHDSKI